MRKSLFAVAALLVVASCLSAQTRQTGHLTFEERGEVIGRLYRLGLENKPEHIPVFCEALKDKNPRVREAAIAQLIFTHDKTAVAPVIGVMKDNSRLVRRCAIAVLERIGLKKAIPALTEALTFKPATPAPSRRHRSANSSLSYEEYYNRLAAAMALHRLGSSAGKGTVLEILKNDASHKSVHAMALKAVIVMDLKEAVPDCIRIAKGWKYFGEDSPGFFALRALWHVADDTHRDEIVEVARQKCDAIGMHAGIWSLALLVKFGDKDVVDVFERSISTTRNHEHIYEDILGLEKFKPKGAADLIVKHVVPPRERDEKTGENKWQREYKLFRMGCETLATIGDKSVVPDIKTWYGRYSKPDDWYWNRLWLAWTLAKLGDDEGRDNLYEALKHEDAAVRRIAAKLLGKLGEKVSQSLLVEAIKKETEPYTFTVMKKSIGQVGRVPREVARLKTPPEAPAPKDTYGKSRYLQFNFDDCATVEAMERIAGLMEELASANVRWVFTIYYAPLSRHDHEYNNVLVQRCFDRGCEIENHTLYHNPDGHQVWYMTEEECRGNLAGCNNWLRAYVQDLDKIYRMKGGGGGFVRPGDRPIDRASYNKIRREANFTNDLGGWWRAPSLSGWDLFAPPFHPRPERDDPPVPGRPRLISPWSAGDLRYAYDAEDPDERIRAFKGTVEDWYFNHPDRVMRVIGHDWPNSSIPDRPGNEVHWDIFSGHVKEALLKNRDRYPLIRSMTELELVYLFHKKVPPEELITRKVHLQTGKW